MHNDRKIIVQLGLKHKVTMVTLMLFEFVFNDLYSDQTENE